MAFEKTVAALMAGVRKPEVVKALKAEIADEEQADFDRRLEELNAEAVRRKAEEAKAAEAAVAEEQRVADLALAEAEFAGAAADVDQALADLGRTFSRLDELADRIGQLDRNRRSDVLSRRWTMLRAVWHHARPLAMRLKLANPPGGQSKNAPLVDALSLREVGDA